ncbi:reticulon-4b isoform X1 [Electrophorus electricus]|uniref:reticulon-4b isoform X1 n=1 Tax=Electrophorus electricus TaxID=8005 RepID=UPI0015D06759|nr:reticulon-4b isoform X1 [Electrophorus electricus]
MADSERVSSTTQNEVEDEPKAQQEFGLGGLNISVDATDEYAGLVGGAQYVTGLQESPRPEPHGSHQEGAEQLRPPVPSALEHEALVTSTVAEEAVAPITNTAETELREKIAYLNSVAFEVAHEPDSTRTGAVYEVTVKTAAVPGPEALHALVTAAAATVVAEPLGTSSVKPGDAAGESFVYQQNVIQEEEISTTQTVRPTAAPVVEPEAIFQSARVTAAPAAEPVSTGGPVGTVTSPPGQPTLEEPTSAAPAPSHEPSLPPSVAVAAAPPLMQFSSEIWNSSPIASQASTKITMDSFNDDSPSRNTPRYDLDVLNQSDDDLMLEMKKNPFQGFSPVDSAVSEFSHFGETTEDTRAAAKMSDSPSPDLVQNAHEGEFQGEAPLQDFEQSYVSREAVTESLRQQLASSDLFSTASKGHGESGLPPSLPDILKSSPHNHDKLDSGSSEGSPDFSPVHRSGNDSPNAPFSMSANNPFAFDTKIPLLKEMTEETEARAAEKAKLEEEKASEQMFGAFDLVKVAEISPKGIETIAEEQDDFKTSSQDSVPMVDKFECLSFPTGKAQDHSDSESPSADSLSPVLEAMAKNPTSFQIEPEKSIAKEEAEAADEVSEQEVSSEEFEFLEKPPRGAIDEFLETLDNTKFAKASEIADVEDTVPKPEERFADAGSLAQEIKNQSSYLLLTEPLDGSSPGRGKAGLELSDFQVTSQIPVAPSTVVKTEAPTAKKVEPKDTELPSLSSGAVVDLLYWRDVKNTGVVFGALLLLLLSLSACSIISVLSYVALALLSVSITFRIYKGVLQAIQKSDEGHPFKLYLDQEIALSQELVHKYSDVALGRVNAVLIELRRLFLVEDLVDSLKFAVVMWILTYVGALFNGLTLLILGLVCVFTIPIIYEKHQTQIDHYVALVNNQIKDIVGKIQAKIPGAKKKSE